MVVIRPIESKVMDGGGWWATRPLGSHRPCCDRLCDEMLDGFLPVRARSSHSGNRLGKKNKISKRKFLEANSQINSQRSDDYLANVFFPRKRGPAPVVIERLENFHLFSKLFLYAMHGYKNSHVCFFILFFLFDFIWEGLTPAAIFPRASAQSSFLSLMQFLF